MIKKSSRFRFFAFAGVLLSGAVVLSGCGKGALPEERRADPTAGGKAPRIVVITGDRESNWSAAQQGALDAGKALGAEIEWQPLKANYALAEQKKLVYDAIDSNAAGIAIAPIDATEMVPPINKAGKKYVPAIVFDSPAHTKFKLSYVSNDHVEAGVLAARHAGKTLPEKSKIGVLTAPPNTGGAEAAHGFEETLRKEFPGVEIVAVAPGANASVGVLFAPEEAIAREALKNLAPQTKLIAVGYSDDLLDGLKSGKISALIVPDRYQMAYESIRGLLEYRKNNPPKLQIPIKPILITKETLNAPESRKVLGLK